jgi:hypothetical protein
MHADRDRLHRISSGKPPFVADKPPAPGFLPAPRRGDSDESAGAGEGSGAGA